MGLICFVILHYGDIHVTEECVDSIMQLTAGDKVQIVIVDNDFNKADSERKRLSAQYCGNSQVTVVPMQEEAGFSQANNCGYAYAKKMYNPDYIVVANNDIIFAQKDFAEQIQKIYDRDSYAVLSPDIVSREGGRHQSPIDTEPRTIRQLNYTIAMNAVCLRLFPVLYPLLSWNYGRERTGNAQEKSMGKQEDIVPCGACIVLSKTFIQQEDRAFEPETQFYYEEYILHYRCRKKQYKILYSPEVQVIHGDGVATKKNAEGERARLRFVMHHTLQSAKIYRQLIKEDIL